MSPEKAQEIPAGIARILDAVWRETDRQDVQDFVGEATASSLSSGNVKRNAAPPSGRL